MEINKQKIYQTILWLNSLLNSIADWSKLEALADNKVKVTKNLKFVVGSVENIVGKNENVGNQHFPPFPTMFSKGFYFKVVKSQYCVVKS